MDDLTITRLCAEALGYTPGIRYHPKLDQTLTFVDGQLYHPLTNDAQAMALIKELRMQVVPMWIDKWHAIIPHATFNCDEISTDLNRAICLAVAKMQKEKA